MKRKLILCLLIALLMFAACSPSAQNADTDQENAGISSQAGEEVNPEQILTDNEEIYPVADKQSVVEDLNVEPVTISYISKLADDTTEIVTLSLNRNHSYAPLPVKDKTILKADPRIDEAGNVYLMYGIDQTYFTKLGPDGTVETKELEVYSVVETLWVGHSLLICQHNADNELLVINTQFELETVGDVACMGKMGLSNGKMDKAVWLISSEADGKTTVSYKTYDPLTKAVFEGSIDLPFESADLNQTSDDPMQRYAMSVVAVDTETENVVLNYMAPNTESNENSYWFEVYDPKQQQTLAREPGGGIFYDTLFSGDGIYSYGDSVSALETMARRISDLSAILSASDYEVKKNNGQLNWDWVATNGALWYRMNNEVVLIYNNQGALLAQYESPQNLPEAILQGSLIRPSLPFYGNE